MVTFNGKQKRTSTKKSYSFIPSMDKYEWMISGGLTIIIVYAVVNAAFFYNGDNTNTSTDYNNNKQHQLDNTIFADKKETPLVTKITNVITQYDDLIKVSFIALNVNATIKLEKFECMIDAFEWKDCSSPFVLNSRDDGQSHTLEIRAIDNQGGIEVQPAVHIYK